MDQMIRSNLCVDTIESLRFALEEAELFYLNDAILSFIDRSS